MALLALAGWVWGARLYGTVFDSSLEPLDRALVTLNTTPEQRQVAVNGTYDFSVALGVYEIVAEKRNATAAEEVAVTREGEYRLDLIAFTPLEGGLGNLSEILDERQISLEETDEDFSSQLLLAAVLLLAAGLLAAFWKLRKTGSDGPRKISVSIPSIWEKMPLPAQPAAGPAASKPLTADQQRVVDTIKSFDNRVSQKELRKALNPWSEAKVSMELTELEDHEVIRKIKKGRGNIIRID